eukprot:scaffold1348_cov184-Ochromonas_danica.AAC.5
MDDLTLSDLLAQYDSAKDPKSLSTSFVRKVLKELRKSKVTRSDIVLLWGPKLLSGESYIDVWNLHEQICIAAIDQGNFSLAAETITKLKKQFLNSHRVVRLHGMLLEAQGKYKEALNVYDEILKDDLANVAAMKRKASIHKAQGNVSGQIEEINNILKIFPGDGGSWAELGEVYLSQCDYPAAIHCFEELVLLDPRNAHHHSRLAEALYSLGEIESVRDARRHYTISLNFQAGKYNLRALYGLVAACKTIQRLDRPSSSNQETAAAADQETKVNEQLLSFAKEQLESLSEDNKSNGALALVKNSIL